MNSENQEQNIKALRKNQLVWVYILTLINVFLLYYLYFGNGHISNTIIKFFIFTASVSIFFQVKNLKESPDKYAYIFAAGEGERPGYNQNDRLMDSIKKFSKVQFSKDTIGKAEEILNRSAIKKKDLYDMKAMDQHKLYQQTIQSNQELTAEDQSRVLRNRGRHDKSVLDEVSMDWPSRILNDKKPNITRDYKRAQTRGYPSSNINASKNYSKGRAEHSINKKASPYLSRYDSNREAKRTVSRYSSKGKNTLQKASVNTRSFYHHELNADLEKANERQVQFQTMLSNLHIDFKKYDYWVHHNIQVWLAFSFIPELVKRNHVI